MDPCCSLHVCSRKARIAGAHGPSKSEHLRVAVECMKRPAAAVEDIIRDDEW